MRSRLSAQRVSPFLPSLTRRRRSYDVSFYASVAAISFSGLWHSLSRSSSTTKFAMEGGSKTNMRAVVVKNPGGPEQLEVKDGQPFPTLLPEHGAANSLTVKVKATDLNRADILQRQGNYPPPPGASNILGLEMSGVVEKVHGQLAEEAGWKPGDRVW